MNTEQQGTFDDDIEQSFTVFLALPDFQGGSNRLKAAELFARQFSNETRNNNYMAAGYRAYTADRSHSGK